MTSTMWWQPQTTLTGSGDETRVASTSFEFALESAQITYEYPDMVAGVPVTWIDKYASLAVEDAAVAEVDPGVWYAEVPYLAGAGIDGDTADEALAQLHDAVAGWVAVKLKAGARVPVIAGLDLNPRPE